MNPARALSRHRHLAMAMAALALFAQLWMGQVSTSHLAQMLSEQFLRGDVCAAQDAVHEGDAGPDGLPGGHSMGSAFSCPVCSAATAGFLPAASAPRLVQLPQRAPYRAVFASVPARPPRHAALMPPAQAPPAART